MSQVSHIEAASGRPAHRRRPKDKPATQDASERFTPLLTREHYTFSCMRTDQRGPRTFSALCIPGWKQS
jgi:hypothetical protein